MCLRSDLPGNGPRGLAVSADGRRLAVAAYFSGNVLLADPRTARVDRVVALPNQPPADLVRRGETVFHDATRCYQQWLSCATCHPDGRADGLNWDLLNDGIGNPKNTKSLLLSHRTPPAMSRGVRAGMETAAEAGFRRILFQRPKPDDLRAVVAYLRNVRPERSPHLVDGRLSPGARRGKALFESRQTGCSRCHPGRLYTDLRMHDVGTRGESDREATFDTPTLIELWRTAPYLHDGRAATLREVLTSCNTNDRHGATSHLTGKEIDALVEYLHSL
jgi:cytochrome c peroxidase